MAERAIAIAPDMAEAFSTLAWVEEQYERNDAAAESLYEKVFRLDPRHSRARAQHALWGFCRDSMSAEEALAESAQAVRDDPLNAWVNAMHSNVLGFAGRHAESMVEAEHALRLDAESFFPHWNLMRAAAWEGSYDRAIGLGPSLLGDSGRHPWVLGALAWTHEKAGHPEAVQAIHDEMEARSRLEFVSASWLAIVAASAGLTDDVSRHLERAVTERDPLLAWVRHSPFCDSIRTHPRLETALPLTRPEATE
jgi:tetratricopeptide (TPR) repeat protein